MSAASRSHLHISSISPFRKSSYQQPPRPLPTSLSSKRLTTPSSASSRLSGISTTTSPVVLLCLLTDRRQSRDQQPRQLFYHSVKRHSHIRHASLFSSFIYLENLALANVRFQVASAIKDAAIRECSLLTSDDLD
ncbi:hypothetical protein ACFE04_014005 [Oxalis oulophora]